METLNTRVEWCILINTTISARDSMRRHQIYISVHLKRRMRTCETSGPKIELIWIARAVITSLRTWITTLIRYKILLILHRTCAFLMRTKQFKHTKYEIKVILQLLIWILTRLLQKWTIRKLVKVLKSRMIFRYNSIIHRISDSPWKALREKDWILWLKTIN